jgi:glycosyltransferase involved in cell wall biosynthesis
MRILISHNRYLRRGGEDECFEAERDLLRAHGHSVDEHVAGNQFVQGARAALVGLKGIWNHAEYEQIRARIRKTNAEVVHVHNFFPRISPAIYYAAAAERVPVVQTLHNYRLLCPAALLFREGQPCEDCLGRSIPWRGVWHGCYRASRSATAAVATITTAHRLLGTWSRQVSAYIVLTEFARHKFIAGGLPTDKLYVKPNFVPDPGAGLGNGDYALYVGRLSEEKGIRVLLDAWGAGGQRALLKIIGSGPLEPLVREHQQRNSSIEYLGYRPPPDVYALMKCAVALIVPSLSYEGLPLAIAEAFAAGTPVIASRMGAMDSLVKHGSTGLKFRVGDGADLVEQVKWMWDHPAEQRRMREQARAEYLHHYTPERNYELLIRLYEFVLRGGAIVRRSGLCT